MPEENKKITNIRNIGIMAHIDAGKTTTTESILYLAGKIHKVGKVHDGDTVTDFDPQEKARGITIFSAAVTVDWKDCQVNIIDTPGHVDFTAEVERSLRVLDGGIVVMDGKKGVEAQTETVWRQANKYKIPRLIFVNKMDSVDSVDNFDVCLKSIREKLNATPFPVQFPIGAGRDLKGVVDIVEKKAYYFQPGDKTENYRIEEIPQELLVKTKKYRQELIEKAIEYDEDLALKYLEGKELEVSEIKKLLRQATITGNFFPVFCGSAYKNVGIKPILDGVVNYLPSPMDIGEITAFSPHDKTQQSLINCNSPISCLALAFKIVVDDYNNRLTFFRVYAGKISANSYVYNARGKRERISRLLRLHADDKEEIKEVGAGDIAAAIGLEFTITGDTLCEEKNPLLLETIDFAEPVISQAIEPKTNEDKNKLRDSLEKLKVQDPSFKFWIDRETGQMIISGMGELHLEILVERLRRECKLDIETKQQKVAYRETIKNFVEVKYLHKKQTGGRGERAEVHLKFEPNEGKGFEFVDAIRGEDVPKQFRPSIKAGLENVLSDGILLGYPIVDVKVTLFGGGYHPVDSSMQAFERAGYDAFKENAKEFELVLLEPLMKVEIDVPKEYYGNVLGDLVSRRGEIESTDEKNEPAKIYIKVPLSEMFGYSTIIRSLTKGRGGSSMEFSHYQEVPKDTFQKILKKEKL